MTNIQTARTQVSTARSQLEEAKKQAEEARLKGIQTKEELLKQKSELPEIRSQEALRQKFTGLQGLQQRQKVLGVETQIGEGVSQTEKYLSEVEEYKEKIIKPFQSQVETAEAQIAEYDIMERAQRMFERGIWSGWIKGPEYKYLHRLEKLQSMDREAFSRQVDKIQSSLPKGETLIVDWKNLKVQGVDSKALQQSLPVIDGQIRFGVPSPSVSAPSLNVTSLGSLSAPNLSQVPVGSIDVAPSLGQRLKTEWIGKFNQSGNIVSATLGTASGLFKSVRDRNVQKTGDYYQYEGIQNLIGVTTEVAPYFTPVSLYLLIGGGVSKLVTYPFKPEILQRKGESVTGFLQEKAGITAPSWVGRTLVATADVGQIALGGLGVYSQFKASQIAKSKPQTEFFAEVRPSGERIDVNVISRQVGKGVEPNVAISKQYVIDKAVSGKTISLTQRGKSVEVVESFQIGKVSTGKQGVYWRGQIGKEATSTLFSKTASAQTRGMKIDISNLNRIDNLKTSKMAVDKGVKVQTNIGTLFDRGTGSDFLFVGGSSPKLRIYKTGGTSLVAPRDTTGIIRVVTDTADDFVPTIFKTADKSKVLTQEVQSAIVSGVQKTQSVVTPSKAVTIGTEIKVVPLDIKVQPQRLPAQSIFYGTGQYEQTDGFVSTQLRPSTSKVFGEMQLQRPQVSFLTTPKVETASINSFSLDVMPKTLSVFKLKQDVLQTDMLKKTQTKEMNKPQLKQDLLTKFEIVNKLKLKDALKLKINLLQTQTMQKLLQKQKQKTSFATPTKTKTTGSEPLIKPIIPIGKSDSGLRSLINKAKESPSFFEAFGRRKSKDISLGKFRGQEEAEVKLKSFLTGTLGASGKIKADGEELEFSKLRFAKSPQFRAGKSESTRVVQKRAFRLGTFGEKKEIQKSKRGFSNEN